MTTTMTEAPICRHCHGTGRARPAPKYNAKQAKVLADLREVGTRRAELVGRRAYMRTEGRLELDKIYDQLRKLIGRGDELGVRALDMQDALQVSSAAYTKIRSGQTGAA